MTRPSKLSLKWKGPLVIREAHSRGYYRLAEMDGKDLMDPINGKWLKRYYAYKKKLCSYPFCLMSFMFLFFLQVTMSQAKIITCFYQYVMKKYEVL